MLVAALNAAVDDDQPLSIDACAEAIAASATVAALVEGGPVPDVVYGPKNLGGLVADDHLRAAAIAALKSVLEPNTEWSELWSETEHFDDAKVEREGLIRVLESP
ncbi:MAG: DUF4259 domain-containing protein [Gordonia sp. (in: high G+C Gram-positive bacteria)]